MTPILPMNTRRIILGGMVAGLIMNVGEAALHAGLLGDDSGRLFQVLGVAPPAGAGTNIFLLVAATFILGITAVWLYAAFLPRFGRGPRTALFAGIAVWVLAHLWSGVYLGAGYSGIIPPRLAWIPVLWGLLEAPLATLAGAALYRETGRS